MAAKGGRNDHREPAGQGLRDPGEGGSWGGRCKDCCLLPLRLATSPQASCARLWAEPALFTIALILSVETRVMTILQMRKPRLREGRPQNKQRTGGSRPERPPCPF